MSLRTSGIRSGDLLNTNGGDEFRVCLYDDAGSHTASISVNEPMVTTSATAPQFYAPYSNVCPIYGHTAATAHRTGKNLLNPSFSAYSQNFNYSYIDGVVPDGAVARFTFVDKDTSVDVSGIYIGFAKDDLSQVSAPTVYRWAFLDGNITNNTSNRAISGELCRNVFVHPKTEDVFNRIFARYYVMVEFGSVATEFEPYNGDTYTVQFGDTIYGGTLDFTTGLLTATIAGVKIGDLTWTYAAGGSTKASFRASKSNAHAAKGSGGQSQDDAKCSAFKTVNPTTSSQFNAIDFGVTVGNTSITNSDFIVLCDSYTNVASFVSDFNDETIVYRLATPQTIQLTPKQIMTHLGTNNIWATTTTNEP